METELTQNEIRQTTNLWSAVLRLAVLDYKAGKLGWRYFFTPYFCVICERARTTPSAVRLLLRACIKTS